jgi:hypothetical protein
MTRRVRALVTAAALVAAVPQILQYAGHVWRGDYPGSAWNPRVAAVIRASRAALKGGPFVTVPAGEGYSVAPGQLADLGVAAIADLISRTTGHRVFRTTLGCLNLLFLVAACAALVAAYPPKLRLALVPVLLLVPIIVPLYRNVDSVAIHGALAALAIALAITALRIPNAWSPLACGVALFIVHKVRSPFAMYALLPLVTGAMLAWWRSRDRGPALRLAVLMLGFALCELPWQVAMSRRLADPRVVDRDVLTAHTLWEPLISGIGWTENPWGIKPSDPWVATYLGEHVRAEPVPLETPESERRARLVYLGFVREQPFALLWLYLRRIPFALSEYSWLGPWGAVLWVPLSAVALLLALARRDRDGLATMLACLGLACGLVAQIVLIDTRYIYAYPLRLVSALVLSTSALVAYENRGRPERSAT